MADQKITALTENTTPIETDIIPIVDDPSGTPETQKVTITNLFTGREVIAPTITSSISPTTTGLVALGSSSSMFTNLFLASGGKVDFNNGDVTITHSSDAINVAGGKLGLAAGTTTIAPLKFTSGTNLTTAEAGAMEYDGTVGYFSHAASARGVNLADQFIRLTSAYTIPTQGPGLRAIFNSPANGAITLKGSTTYEFELNGVFTSMSATSGTASFGFLGTASSTSLRYTAIAFKGAATPSTAQISNISTSTSTAITGATTGTGLSVMIKGIIAIDTGGTLIPALGNSVEANPIAAIGTIFSVRPIGSNTVQSVGNWS